jgi:outer membrane protein assembly factor BamE (lipoprotein component of BamABCDE complex)
MIKQILLILSILICTGCSTISSGKPYNTPFINTDDTIQLQQGMSKASVLENIGYPLYVKSGVNNTIVWIYEVRSTEVSSDTDLLSQEVTVNKTNANKRHSSPIHQLEIIFVNNKIKQWEMTAKAEKSNSILPELPSGSPIAKILGLIPFI